MTAPRLHVSCCELNPGCEVELFGSTPDELVVAYARHATGCRHGVRHVDLDALLGAITWVPAPADLRWAAGPPLAALSG